MSAHIGYRLCHMHRITPIPSPLQLNLEHIFNRKVNRRMLCTGHSPSKTQHCVCVCAPLTHMGFTNKKTIHSKCEEHCLNYYDLVVWMNGWVSCYYNSITICTHTTYAHILTYNIVQGDYLHLVIEVFIAFLFFFF